MIKSYNSLLVSTTKKSITFYLIDDFFRDWFDLHYKANFILHIKIFDFMIS